MEFFLDRRSDVPLRRQIRATIQYHITCGELTVGALLPSVRDLAEQLNVAPMTISQVYADLKREGMIETRTGAGTFVVDSAQAQLANRVEVGELHRALDDLIDRAEAQGMGLYELRSLINARLAHRASVGRQASLFVAGLFADATRSYARAVSAVIGGGATVQPATVDRLQTDPDLRARANSADLVVTFSSLRAQVALMVPNAKVVAIRFIPSEATRLALASLDPVARIAAVSTTAEFLPILLSGVQRFAAHCRDLVDLTMDDPNAARLLADRDVVIHATGAEGVAAKARSGAVLVEYRHIPDPGDIERLVMPLVREGGADIAAQGKETA